MTSFKIISGEQINIALEKMNSWHFRSDPNTYMTFNKLENILKKNWLWKTKEINKLKELFNEKSFK